MRKIVSYLVYSINGVVRNPQDWVCDCYDDEIVANVADLISTQDAVLFGRKTYEEFKLYWEDSDIQPFAAFINDTPKYVPSNTLTDPLTWKNSTLLQGDVAAEIEKLKSQPGGDIGVHGSPTLMRFLLQAGLLDELRLALFPVVAHEEGNIFEGYEKTTQLKLADSRQTKKGVTFLTYTP